MTPERWQKIRRVLEAAVSLSPAQRQAFLHTAAKEDPDLRAEVDSLLARDRSDSFLQDPAVQASDILRFLQEGPGPSKAKLQPGERLGNYAVLSSLGAGGMGEVYKAKDLRLGREVAIKVLPEAFSADKERLARFEREAKLLAALSHANVATLYELNESDGLPLLVMELVEGETLEERIARGPLSVDEAIPLFVEIAEGLEAAHEKGIIHRDLKPANVKIQPSGKPKILDFGLAKVLAEDPSRFDPAESPTVTKGTALGVNLGTAHYMSPEQARGGAVDHRTDIWAFGCCLYEALTGKKAFEGSTVTDILAAILTKAPELDGLPGTTPPRIRELLGKCLQKPPGRRLRDIGDARFDLEAPSRAGVDELPPKTAARKTWGRKGVAFGFIGGAHCRRPRWLSVDRTSHWRFRPVSFVSRWIRLRREESTSAGNRPLPSRLMARRSRTSGARSTRGLLTTSCPLRCPEPREATTSFSRQTVARWASFQEGITYSLDSLSIREQSN
jgi:serine/threonine protein kinase